MFWPEGLFIILDALIDLIVRAVKQLKPTPRQPKLPHWRDMDYKYLEALNELNVMCPTETEEEKGLAKYLEFNSEEDHVRRQRKNEEPYQSRGPVGGSFTTLLSPGLSQSLGGGLAQLGGGLLGGLGARGYQEQQLNQLGQQLLTDGQRMMAQMQQQMSAMQPGTSDNNINPFYEALKSQQKNNGPH